MASLRAQVGLRLYRDLSVLAGVGAGVAIGTDGQDADVGFGPQSVSHSGATTVRVYPSLLLGLQI